MRIETAAVDHVGFIPESNLEQIGERTYIDNRTGTILVQEENQVITIDAE
jgi:hypothetical protein